MAEARSFVSKSLLRINNPALSAICKCAEYDLGRVRDSMIKITRLNHTPLIVNSDLIEHIEVTPDTVITLTSGQKYMVLETTEEIIERVIAFRQSLLRNQPFQSTLVAGTNPAANFGIGEPRSNG